LTTKLLSSRAAKLFPALSFEDTWSTVRTNKLVPLGMVTARVAKGVSKMQTRLKAKAVAYLIIFAREFEVIVGLLVLGSL
jgi:hypothetical protein